MKYWLYLAGQYMKRHRSRTIYSICGIMITFILCFAIFTTGYSIWDYAYLINGGDQAQLWVETDNVDEDGEECGLTAEMIQQLRTLEKCEEVRKLWIQDDSAYDEAVMAAALRGEELAEEDAAPPYVSVDELQVGDSCFVQVGLKDLSDLQASAKSLHQQTGLNINVDTEIESYLGQGDSTMAAAYHAVVALLGSVFAFFCIMILRNTMMISVVERMQDYGLYRCVGMSRKQLYQLLATEGLLMSLVATMGGVGLGYGLLQAITPWLNSVLELEMYFRFGFYFKAVLYTTALCVAVTVYSLIEPARQAGRISPIEAIHNNIVLRNRKGKLVEKLQYHQGKLWGRIFGVTGEYAYKNMRRNRGRSVGLFCSLLLCVVMIGFVQSGSESLYATIMNTYQGKNVEYLETVYPEEAAYDETIATQIRTDLENIDSVQKTGLLIGRDEIYPFDPTLAQYMEGKIQFCRHIAYDSEQMQSLQSYLLAGEADYQAMTQNNGVLLCDMEYNVANQDTDYVEKDIRRTKYQVGDKIKGISTDGEKHAYQIFYQALYQVAEQNGISATAEEADELWLQQYRKDRESGEDTISTQPEEFKSLEYLFEGDEGFEECRRQMIRLFQKQGIDLTEVQPIKEYNSIRSIYSALRQWEYDHGAVTEYTIQGIITEDPLNGGMTDAELGSGRNIVLIHSQDAVKQGWIDNKLEGSYAWVWFIEVGRDPESILDGRLEKYCKEQRTGCKLTSWYIFDGVTGYDIQEYLDMLKTLRIVRMITIIVTVSIVVICLIQVFNTLCANIALRRKELWLYEVVGMSSRQKRFMLLLEHGVATVASVIVGYLLAWGMSWYFIKYLMDQNGIVQYIWPDGLVMAASLFIVALVEIVSILGIRSTAKRR